MNQLSKKKMLLSGIVAGIGTLFAACTLIIFVEKKTSQMEVVNIVCDRIYYDSLFEVENDSTLIVEAVPKGVLGQKVTTSYDYEFKRELPGSGYTQREIEVTKVYKGNVSVGETITFLQDYYLWTDQDNKKQLISITSLKPLEEGEKYLMFLHYEENMDSYIAVCDYQGVYPIKNLNGAKKSDFSYIYSSQDISNLMPIYSEVQEKYVQ